MTVSNAKEPTIKEELNQQFYVLDSAQATKKKYEIGLVITTYNRPFYLHRTLASLRKSILTDTVILLIDDKSNDLHTLKLLIQFELENVPVIKFFRKKKEGCLMFENLQIGWTHLLKTFSCKYLVNLDADAIVKPEWLLTLRNVHQQQKLNNSHVLITGFNAYQHSIIRESKDYYYKKSIGGVNLFFDELLYQNTIKPSLVDLQWDDHAVALMNTNNFPIVCTKPSVVQHLGRTGLWSGQRSGTFDFAIDFGDTHPLWMKLRLFWFTSSKNALQFLSNKILLYKLSLISWLYRLWFNRIYQQEKKN